MQHDTQSGYGLWSLVIINSAIFIIFAFFIFLCLNCFFFFDGFFKNNYRSDYFNYLLLFHFFIDHINGIRFTDFFGLLSCFILTL